MRSASSLSTAASTLQRSKSLAAADRLDMVIIMGHHHGAKCKQHFREVQSEQFSALKEQLDHSEKKVQFHVLEFGQNRNKFAKLE